MANAIAIEKGVTLHIKLRPDNIVEMIKDESPKPKVQFNWILYCETRTAKRTV